MGFNETSTTITRLVKTRYEGLGNIFANNPNTIENICKGQNGQLPMARYLYTQMSLEVCFYLSDNLSFSLLMSIICPVLQAELVAQHFYMIPSPEMRDILMLDYIEEVAESVVGAPHLYAFWYRCFHSSFKGYYFTDPNSEMHEMWS